MVTPGGARAADVIIQTLANPVAVAARAAELLASCVSEDATRISAIALAGGTTPKLLYRMLSAEPWTNTLPWPNLRWYFGDERFVPLDHEESNFRMARENLFVPAGVAPASIFPIPILPGDPQGSAAAYDRELVEILPKDETTGVPVFDVVLLGMGDDGHTASLFPGTTALSITDRAVVENRVEKLDTWRITLTVPVLLAARRVIVMVTGSGKSEVLREVVKGALDESRLPSQVLHRRPEGTLWLVDADAAARL